MRVLFFVEPHPIRNSMTHFADVGKRFSGLIGPNPPADFRIFGNKATLSELDAFGPERMTKCLIHPTDAEEDLFNSFLTEWDSEGLETWQNLLNGGDVSDAYLKVLERLYSTFPFDIIVHWGENAAVTSFANRLSIARVAVELGCAREPFFNSIVMDCFGTNGASITPKLTISDIENAVSGKGLGADEALYCYSNDPDALGYEQQFSGVPPSVGPRVLRKKNQIVAFLPLQLYDDANLLCFSKYNSLTDVVLDVVPRLAERGILTIIKCHPASRYRSNAVYENSLARTALGDWDDHVLWLDHEFVDCANARLVAAADFIVTVNSSVGFEALYYDKPVVVLGEAIFKPQGVFPTIEEMIEGRFDQSAYLKHISFLRRFFLDAYLLPDAIMSDVSLFYQRLVALKQFSQAPNASPADIAKNYFECFSTVQRCLQIDNLLVGTPKSGVSVFTQPQIVHHALAAMTNSPDIAQAPLALKIAAKSIFDCANISGHTKADKWLRAVWRDPKEFEKIIVQSGVFDSEYYLAKYSDVRQAGMNAAHHYANYGRFEGRAPNVGLESHELSHESLLALWNSKQLDASPLLQFPLDSAEQACRVASINAARKALVGSSKEFAVVAHFYYRDLIPEFLDALDNIKHDFDLIVTIPNWGTQRTEQMVTARYPKAVILRFPNRGRDIGPFLEVLPILLERNYAAILKLQTKRGYYLAGKVQTALGKKWRNIALRSLLGSPQLVDNILTAFKERPSLNMVGSAPLYLSLAAFPYADKGEIAGHFKETRASRSPGFFAGTMFWVRPDSLRPLVTGQFALDITSFGPETGANDGCFAHIVERLFGHITGDDGRRFATTDTSTGDALNFNASPVTQNIHSYMTSSQNENETGALLKAPIDSKVGDSGSFWKRLRTLKATVTRIARRR